jgi:hypothetical protein
MGKKAKLPKEILFFHDLKRPKNGQMAKSFYSSQIVSIKAKLGWYGFLTVHMATLLRMRAETLLWWCPLERKIILPLKMTFVIWVEVNECKEKTIGSCVLSTSFDELIFASVWSLSPLT